jgi:hypothetical protein
MDAPATTRVPEVRVTPRSSLASATLGLSSLALLVAAFFWAHHWGGLADTIVAAWAAATLGSLVMSLHFYGSDTIWPTYLSRRLTKIGLVAGGISTVALVLAGIAWGAGLHPAGSCGGG